MRVKSCEVRVSISFDRVDSTGADVERYLGVTDSCVTRMISSGKKEDVDDNLNFEL